MWSSAWYEGGVSGRGRISIEVIIIIDWGERSLVYYVLRRQQYYSAMAVVL